MRWATLLFALGACLLPDAAAATETTDESEYFLRVWRTDDGLPPLVTPTLIESPEGYLWMESAAGLVRFDGERFVTFDASAIGWPAGTRAARTFADGRQGLWVVLSDASVWRERGGKWAQWVVLPKGESAHIIHPIRDSDGGVHIGTSRGRLLRCTDTAPGFLEVMAVAGFGRWLEWPGADGSVWFTKGNDPHRWLAGRIERAPLAEPDIRNPYYYSWKDGTMWIIGADCVAKWNGLAFQKLPPIPRLAPQEVAGILPAPPHGVWATTVNRIFFLPTGAKEWKVAGPWGTHAEQRQRMNLSDSRGHKWIATYGFGFLRVTPDGKHIPVRLPPELAANRILNLIEDRERNIWGVAEGSGLVRLRQRHFIVHRADKALSDPEVLAIAEDAGGAIWAGSRAGGVDVYSEGVWQHRALPPGDEPAAGATSILAAPDGSVWAGTVARGVWRSEGDTWKMLGDGKESARVLFADTAGTVWMGGPKGLFQWLANQWKAAPATGTISTARALAEDSSGRVWVATENGVWRGDKSGPFSPVPESEGLPSESSYAISIEPDGTVWIGFESGLAQWRDGHAALYRPDDGLPVRKILGIFPGGGSHLWVSSPDGLAALDRTRLTMKKGEPISGRLFTRADGLPTREASGGFQPAALRSRDGHCWLPTHQGLVEFDSEEIPPPALPPPVVIEEAFAMRQNTRLPLEVPPLRASAVPIELAPGMRRLEFRFTAPSLSAPEKVHFRWRMDGLDNEWSEPLPRRNATYPYVPSGRYAFRVVACNGDGVWNETGVALSFIVPPLWHERTEFWVAVAVGLAAICLIILRQRYRRKIERLQLLSALDHERARIAQDIHDDLGATLTQISMWSAVAQKRADHTVSAHLERIRERSNEAVRSLDQIVWAVNPGNDTVRKFATYVCQAAGDFFRETPMACRIDLVEPIEDGPLNADVRHHLVLAAREACTNALRHSGGSEVVLRVEASPTRIVLIISDNGTGFAPTEVNTDGEGLTGMARRLKEVGGTCSVESGPGKGTSVRLEWQIGGEARSP